MAIGEAIEYGGTHRFNGRITPFVVFACVVAATGGIIFGYDIGISGLFSHFAGYCVFRYVLFNTCEIELLMSLESVEHFFLVSADRRTCLFLRWSYIDGAILEEVLPRSV